MSGFTELIVEQAALAWVERLGWSVRHGLEIAPGEPGAERVDYAQVVPETRLREALRRLNPQLPGSVGGCLPVADTPRRPGAPWPRLAIGRFRSWRSAEHQTSD